MKYTLSLHDALPILDIVSRALPLFDEVIIAIGINAEKKYMFSLEERVNFIKETFQDNPKIKVDTYHGLTALYCKKIGAQFILRGRSEERRVGKECRSR